MVCLRIMCRPGEGLRGKRYLVLPAPEDPMEFAMIGAADMAPQALVGVATAPEIVVGAVI